MKINVVLWLILIKVALSLADQKLSSQVHEIVGRINGRFGTLTAVPIHHLVRLNALNLLTLEYKPLAGYTYILHFGVKWWINTITSNSF